jgi:SPP1 gp7 family putative phage head morphogenesis protein
MRANVGLNGWLTKRLRSMAHKQVRVVGKREVWASRFAIEKLRGKPLIIAGHIASDYNANLQRYIDRMIRDVLREVEDLYVTFAADGESWAMDASTASQARILSNAMRDKFAKLFGQIAQPVAEQMTKRAEKDSGQKLNTSLKEMSGQLVLQTRVFNDKLRDVLTATVAENVALIKRIPEKFLDNVQGAVMRSIQSGNGLADLQPQLNKYGVQVKNWAKNVALDQTRKAYNGINAQRMQALGVKEFEWVHSGGSNHPREYHRDVLNGKIFSFDDLPHLDGPNQGERGIPGQAPYCRCTMRPIFRFNDDDE